MRSGRRRPLTRDELALWALATRHVAPMPGKAAPQIVPAAPAEAPSDQKASPAPALPPASHNPPAARGPGLEPLDRRLRRRLARGQHPVDAVLDLHGMRQDEAHEALRSFLRRSQAQGAAVVLVVTGKGSSSAHEAGAFAERGVLRRMVPHWLRLADMRPLVVGFEEAAFQHGGAGALYLRIRRGTGPRR